LSDRQDISAMIKSLQNGQFILLHDDDSRENETDIMLPAKHVTPKKIYQMRELGGGLLCVAVAPEIGAKLELPYMWEILLKTESESLPQLVNKTRSVSKRSTHSITFNHRRLGGATDSQRSDTISSLHNLCQTYESNDNFYNDFYSDFESPGHLQMLIGSPGLLNSRDGHTELSLFLCKLANLTPVIIMCEILDNQTFNAKSVTDCKNLAKKHNLTFIESHTVIDYYKTIS
tara:strand:- start:4460 stop:5152 length:693 start_codon:yes stop_codon:yes gene_type:complete